MQPETKAKTNPSKKPERGYDRETHAPFDAMIYVVLADSVKRYNRLDQKKNQNNRHQHHKA
jgi:hypothetical protein